MNVTIKNKEEWQQLIDNNKNDASKTDILKFAWHWMGMMESMMENHNTSIINIAYKAGAIVNRTGFHLTRAMYIQAICHIIAFWEYGKEFKNWYDQTGGVE